MWPLSRLAVSMPGPAAPGSAGNRAMQHAMRVCMRVCEYVSATRKEKGCGRRKGRYLTENTRLEPAVAAAGPPVGAALLGREGGRCWPKTLRGCPGGRRFVKRWDAGYAICRGGSCLGSRYGCCYGGSCRGCQGTPAQPPVSGIRGREVIDRLCMHLLALRDMCRLRGAASVTRVESTVRCCALQRCSGTLRTSVGNAHRKKCSR